MEKVTFSLRGEYIELSSLLKATDLCGSGGAAGALITSGGVKVDGEVELRKGRKIRPGCVVQASGTEIHVRAQ